VGGYRVRERIGSLVRTEPERQLCVCVCVCVAEASDWECPSQAEFKKAK
jgi:hypothetical protein